MDTALAEEEGLILAGAADEARAATATICRVARRTFVPVHVRLATRPGAAVEAAVRFVSEHLQDGIALDDLAAAAGLSKCHFIRRFHNETGLTPGDFLKRFKMARAMELLVGSDQPVSRIASIVGYRNAASFGRTFRLINGTTPSLYRLTRTRQADRTRNADRKRSNHP